MWYYTKMHEYSLREPKTNSANESLKAYPELMQSLLIYRGIDTAEKAEVFLNPDYEKLHDPFLLKDMDKAVERILQAIKNEEKILIYSDYDADGIPAAVVMHDFFKLIGYSYFEIYIPHRHNEGYGLHLEAVESFVDKDIKLIVTLDCGIVDHHEVNRANELGIDVIITDHHVPGKTLPEAYAVINPKRSDCDYPYDMLCGSGVAFKLVQALLSKYPTLERRGRVGEGVVKPGQEKWLLDMVGIATLSDMVPLQGENRIFAHYGLKVLRKSRRPGFQKLLSLMKMNQRYITEDDVGFMITPRINAASRMGIPTDAFHLLSTTDEVRGDELARHLDHINNERKGLVASTVKEIKKI
jgi:single-stranded-DNA-specific exonuclease